MHTTAIVKPSSNTEINKTVRKHEPHTLQKHLKTNTKYTNFEGFKHKCKILSDNTDNYKK